MAASERGASGATGRLGRVGDGLASSGPATFWLLLQEAESLGLRRAKLLPAALGDKGSISSEGRSGCCQVPPDKDNIDVLCQLILDRRRYLHVVLARGHVEPPFIKTDVGVRTNNARERHRSMSHGQQPSNPMTTTLINNIKMPIIIATLPPRPPSLSPALFISLSLASPPLPGKSPQSGFRASRCRSQACKQY
ncbi:hypothetical protein KC325_g42 [Hortaea werneckii]|nr:hypothetical protein KC325_g42 [Hortaea werneckii]